MSDGCHAILSQEMFYVRMLVVDCDVMPSLSWCGGFIISLVRIVCLCYLLQSLESEI